MSKHNKVNPDHYTQAGRLTTDDLAREWQRQRETSGGGPARKRKATPPWMDAETEQQAHGGRAEQAAGATNAQLDDAVAGGRDVTARGERPAPPPKAKTARGAKQRTQARSSAKRSRGAKTPRVKQSGASGTPRSGKAPRARGTATRAASPQRAGRPGAHKTASRGTQKATGKTGTPRGRKTSTKSAPKRRKRG